MAAQGFIPTRSSQINKNAASQFKVVKFESHKAKDKSDDTKALAEKRRDLLDESESKRKELFKRIRHEVTRFGISGFDAPKKLEANVALAVSLGAKPPPNQYKNYKVLMEERKQQKLEKKNREFLEAMNKSTRGATSARRPKKVSVHQGGVGNLLKVYGGKITKNEVGKINRKDKNTKDT